MHAFFLRCIRTVLRTIRFFNGALSNYNNHNNKRNNNTDGNNNNQIQNKNVRSFNWGMGEEPCIGALGPPAPSGAPGRGGGYIGWGYKLGGDLYWMGI